MDTIAALVDSLDALCPPMCWASWTDSPMPLCAWAPLPSRGSFGAARPAPPGAGPGGVLFSARSWPVNHSPRWLDSTSAWKVSPTTVPEQVIAALYRAQIRRANDIVTATPLDAPPKQWPDFFGSWRLADLRAILQHVITETACHAGHLDAARRTDRRQDLAPPLTAVR